MLARLAIHPELLILNIWEQQSEGDVSFHLLMLVLDFSCCFLEETAVIVLVLNESEKKVHYL